MPLVDLSSAHIVIQFTDHDPDDFLVMRYRGTEGLCQLYRFEIKLASKLTDLSVEKIVGNAACLNISTPRGKRWFNGIISRLELTGEALGQTYYQAELVPDLWLLTHRYGSKIFQKKTITEIITAVLTEAGIPPDRCKFSVDDSTPREYCVQYRETDYNFIARLMEEEGMRWFFEQTEDGHILHIQDASAEYQPIRDDASLPYVPPGGLDTTEECVHRFRITTAVRPGAVGLDDFNFERPDLDLQSTSDCGRDKSLAFHDYPGEYVTKAEGGRYAKVRAEAFEASRRTGVGLSDSYRLGPGLKFTLADHPNASLNSDYLVTSVTHQGRQSGDYSSSAAFGAASILDARMQSEIAAATRHSDSTVRGIAEALLQMASRIRNEDLTANRGVADWLHHAGQIVRDLPSVAEASGGHPLKHLTIPNLIGDIAGCSEFDAEGPVYECRFECIPADVRFRPPRVTPWPVMRGTQTARVVGPEGEEIHVDKYGRVKVHFEWDRIGKFGEDDSCWIRVSQGMAGGRYGMMFLPRIGQEVIVDFLEGDPDKPIITGRVYNADHMPPYTLPDEKTKSTIKTNSSKGGEGFNEIRFEDLKGEEQIFIHGEKNLDIRVKNDRFETIGHDRHLVVENDKFEHVKKDRNERVVKNHLEEIGEDRDLTVKGKEDKEVQKDLLLTVKGNVEETFKKDHTEETAKNYTLKALQVTIEAKTKIELKVGGSTITMDPAQIELKAPTVSVSGSAMVKVQGGLVKIN